MAASHHGEAVVVVHVSAALQQSDRLFASVDQIEIFIFRCRRRAHAQDAVLAVQDDLQTFGQVVRDLGRHADAQIDIHTFRNVLRHTRGDLVFGFALVGHRVVLLLRPVF